ncbi:MAG: efflux transporter outer membrane subunit, partial [Caulobacteraceae bacterium]
MMRALAIALLATVSLSACASMAPTYERPALPVAQAWPNGVQDGAASAGDLAWREVFEDTRLQQVIALALTQNRDLRVAVANIEKARAQYRVQRANLFPAVNVGLSESRARVPAGVSQFGGPLDTDQYNASVGVSGYELDLFGRVRSLSQAALQTFFSVEENRRAAQISLIAEVATDYLALATDQDQLKLARDTQKSRDDALTLTRKRFEGGATSQLDVRQAETLAEQARTDAATLAAQVEQDRNALRLVVGAEVPADLMPATGLETIRLRADLPAGLPAEVLTRRPDVLSAEHVLQGENANIGAARAAFFPRITLTGAVGSASTDLVGLFGAGTGAWSFAPQISLPIFNGGANKANLAGARASRDVAVAQYEKAIQTAFREVADALAVQATIRERIASQERLVAAAADTQRLSQARYDRGVDSYLSLLDAQRTFYGAQQTLLNTRFAAAT